MFAVVNHLHFSKPVDELKEIVATDGIPTLARNEGLIDFHFVKTDEFHAIVIIIWKDAECAQAGAKAFGPTWFATHFKPHLVGEENRSVGPVLASYAER